MKNFKQILAEVKREEWDSYIHSMFGGPEQDIKREVNLDQPHVRFARYHLFNTLDWSYGVPGYEGKKTVSLPILKVVGNDKSVAVHLDASMYHSDLEKHNISHDESKFIHKWTGESPRQQPTSQLTLQGLISKRLDYPVPIHKIENDTKNNKLIVHIPSDSVKKAMVDFKEKENKRIEDHERDNDENL